MATAVTVAGDQFKNFYWARHEVWDPIRVALEGGSYLKLPKILQWFTGNIGLPHVHPMRPKIPNCNLQRCYEDSALFHKVAPLTMRTSFKSLRLGLYDEAAKTLIGFRSLKAA